MTLDDSEEVTPAELPGDAIRRLAQHLSELCPAFNRCAGLYQTVRGADRKLFLEGLIDIATQCRDRFDQEIGALKDQLALESVFRPR